MDTSSSATDFQQRQFEYQLHLQEMENRNKFQQIENDVEDSLYGGRFNWGPLNLPLKTTQHVDLTGQLPDWAQNAYVRVGGKLQFDRLVKTDKNPLDVPRLSVTDSVRNRLNQNSLF